MNQFIQTKGLLFSILAVIVLSAYGTISAQTIVDVPSDRDNTLYEFPTGAFSNGAGDHFFAGRTAQAPGTSIRRGLVHFDVVSNIPAGSTILSAEVKVFMSMTISGPSNIELHRVVTDWGEGASHAAGQEGSGAPSQPGDATWIHTFFPGPLWPTIGGSFDAAVSSATSVSGIGFYTFPTNAVIVSDVQDWLDGNTFNFGWIFLGDESIGGTAKRFDTRENLLIANRPVLTVVYTPPPCCIGNRGDINNDGSDSNILDLTYLVDFIFRGGPPAICPKEADLNSDGFTSNILDLTFLVDFIFRGGPPTGPC